MAGSQSHDRDPTSLLCMHQTQGLGLCRHRASDATWHPLEPTRQHRHPHSMGGDMRL